MHANEAELGSRPKLERHYPCGISRTAARCAARTPYIATSPDVLRTWRATAAARAARAVVISSATKKVSWTSSCPGTTAIEAHQAPAAERGRQS